MNIVVLVKQVPDVNHIPDEAWDLDKGTLRRGILESVPNPMDLRALAFACRLRARLSSPGKVIALTMGPRQAAGVLEDAIARGADQGVLLTDPAFAGADTPATAYALGCAIRRIERDIFSGQEYLIVAGLQSVDGDTAQVPPQVAEELGVPHVAQVVAFDFDKEGRMLVTRQTDTHVETVHPKRFPVLLTIEDAIEPDYPAFHRMRLVHNSPDLVSVWHADDVHADRKRVGLTGSRTWVSRINISPPERIKNCFFPDDMEVLLDRLASDYMRASLPEKTEQALYSLGARTPERRGEVWVLAEARDGVLLKASFELVGKAAGLARLLEEKVGVVMGGSGQAFQEQARALIHAGADRIYRLPDSSEKEMASYACQRGLIKAVLERRPQIVLFSATKLGRELAPRVAYATGAGLTADCTGLNIVDYHKGGRHMNALLEQTRPALGGNVVASILTKDSSFQMATVRPGVFAAPSSDASRSGEVVRLEDGEKNCGQYLEVVGREARARSLVALEDAKIIVAAGRGAASIENVNQYLVPLAEALSEWLGGSAEIACSRAAVEEGIFERERQVGQTGSSVSPKLYVAVGVSGAIQHVVGMQRAAHVLSINTDRDSPIFSCSDYGIKEDFMQAVPALVAAIRRRLS